MIYRLLPFLYFMQFLISKTDAEYSMLPLVLYGKKARIEDFPFFAATEVCGATILGRRWLLTAAHCVDSEEKQASRRVYVGGDRLDNSISLKYDEVFIHPKYTPVSRRRQMSYDIAVLRLRRPLKYSNTVKPVKLPEQEFNRRLVFVGRGDDETDERTRYLMRMHVARMSDEDCVRVTNAPNVYNRWFKERTLICGKKPDNRPGICYGDSGGPLVHRDTIVGIASFFFGTECHTTNIAFYTNVITFVPWIQSITGL